jgi:TonB-linked SusC/RagA family outer membrane protein
LLLSKQSDVFLKCKLTITILIFNLLSMKKILLMSLVLMFTLLHGALAQTRTVSGRVTDQADGSGMPGVTVLLKGTTNGVSTNADGGFSLSVPETGGTLVFSSVGMTTQERAIGSETQFNVALVKDSKQLNEVVVTALGIERERKTLGYAVQTLDNQEITRASEQNLVRSLQGRVAGVQISSSSGSPGGATRVQIRGPQSFTGNNQPIYVIDGNIISNSALTTTSGTGGDLNNGVDLPNRAADIDPNNIASISVLKGPAAAALYGSQAASGAIIITTKKGGGANGRSQINLISAVSFDRVNRLPDFQNTYGSGNDFKYDPQNNQSWGPRMNGQNVPDWHTYTLAPSGAASVDSIPLVPHPNNVRDFFQTGTTYNNSVNFSGSNETSSFYTSVSNVYVKSIIPNTNYNRSTVAFNGSTRLFNKLTVGGNVSYVNSGGDLGVQGQSRANIIQTIVNTPRDIEIKDQKDYKDPRYDLNGYYLAGFRNNPYFLLDNNLLTNKVDRVFGNASLSYDPTSWLNIVFRQSVDAYSDIRQQKIAVGTIANLTGRYNEDNVTGRNLTTDFLVNVTRKLGADFVLKGILGSNYQEQRLSRLSVDGPGGLVVPDFYDLSNINGIPVPTKGDSKVRTLGVFADVQLSFRDYLSVDVTGRNDWVSTLPYKNRSFFYPGANASFIFSEAFNLPKNILNLGKIRANIASVGKQAPFGILNPIFTKSGVDDGFNGQYLAPFLGSTIPGFRVGNFLASPDLKSELTTSYEFGTELGFFNNRLTIDATYYNSRSKDIILAVPVASTSGFTSVYTNAGSLENKGIELVLGGTPVKTASGFNWDITATFTRNRNKVLEVTNIVPNVSIGGLSSPVLEARAGQPYGSFLGTRMLRDPNGNIVVSATTGQPLVDPVSATLGNIQPDYLAGLSNTFRFKGLALNVLFDTRQGGKFYSNTINTGYFSGALKETTLNDRQPFLVPGSVIRNTDGTYSPNTKLADPYTYWTTINNIGENALYSASYVKLREASLSYSLPTTLVSKIKLTGAQFTITGRNLFIWTPASQPHLDPEVSAFGSGNTQGYEFYSYPSTRSIGASLRLTL